MCHSGMAGILSVFAWTGRGLLFSQGYMPRVFIAFSKYDQRRLSADRQVDVMLSLGF